MTFGLTVSVENFVEAKGLWVDDIIKFEVGLSDVCFVVNSSLVEGFAVVEVAVVEVAVVVVSCSVVALGIVELGVVDTFFVLDVVCVTSAVVGFEQFVRSSGLLPTR